jgi:polyphosphate kinase 2
MRASPEVLMGRRSHDRDDGPPDEVLYGARYDAPPIYEKKLDSRTYEAELARLQVELAKVQSWVKVTGQKVCIIFEGRDAAGKGGTIKRMTEPLNPRIARVVALSAPTERERGEWYFQRYVAHLPSAGEMVLFDRSWYNRAGVERVMGFATREEVAEFLRTVPDFEHMLVRSGTRLIKYWFSVSAEEQERRFKERIAHPTKRWKISTMDLESRRRWDDYSRAKDDMLAATDTEHAPWYVVESDDKKRARLNCIHHLLQLLPYKDHIREPMELPERVTDPTYRRPPYMIQRVVPRAW